MADYLGQLKEAAPHLKQHYEFASIASPKIRQGIVDLILPHVDSLGLNEVELCALLRNIGRASLAEDIEAQDTIQAVLRDLWP